MVQHALVFAITEEQREVMSHEPDNTGVTHECGCKCCPCGRDQEHDAIMLA